MQPLYDPPCLVARFTESASSTSPSSEANSPGASSPTSVPRCCGSSPGRITSPVDAAARRRPVPLLHVPQRWEEGCRTRSRNDPDRERLHELLACSDVVIDSAEPDSWADSGLDADASRAACTVVCSITACRRTGPYAGRDVPCAVIDATRHGLQGGGARNAAPAARQHRRRHRIDHAVFAIECARRSATRHRRRAGHRSVGE